MVWPQKKKKKKENRMVVCLTVNKLMLEEYADHVKMNRLGENNSGKQEGDCGEARGDYV